MKTAIYSSDKQTHFFQELKGMFSDIKSSNFLAYQLAKRDLQGQYRQSFLGFFWAFAPIIVNSLVWIFLNNSGTVNVNADGNMPYVLFVIIGTTVWSIFTESMLIPLTSVNSAKGILSKINFPKEALLMSGIYKMGFNLILKLVLIAIFLGIYGVLPNLNLLYFFLSLIVIICLSMSIGLILTPIGLIYTDVAKIITTAVPFLMYFTPVVYAVPHAGFFKTLFELNPLTFLFNDARNTLLGYAPENVIYAVVIFGLSFSLLLIGLVIFRKSMPIIIEKIGG
ncbi:ABC transporter permease [Frigoriflavimonas asaccharolytica]|uniref:Lipopolysaccharide transport system permease protein n=1 Tax=Frigoriflavimonas asaccharolytica TaxID=2735899 RepID=A0A8J8GA03_9FLAO|nr:ABC transporter permease [Frigoriflavimonas asaccharolytica]NRS92682.1 lipopolysaccharide transport system permease protein [Frigoriflavimonas asaccharolytica]